MSLETTVQNPYATLQDITDIEPYNEERDGIVMKEVFKVLQKHNALERFGVNLLHNHFEVNTGEKMVETHDPVTRKLTIKPYRNSELREPENLQPTNWTFGEDGKLIASQWCIPTETGHEATQF